MPDKIIAITPAEALSHVRQALASERVAREREVNSLVGTNHERLEASMGVGKAHAITDRLLGDFEAILGPLARPEAPVADRTAAPALPR